MILSRTVNQEQNAAYNEQELEFKRLKPFEFLFLKKIMANFLLFIFPSS